MRWALAALALLAACAPRPQADGPGRPSEAASAAPAAPATPSAPASTSTPATTSAPATASGPAGADAAHAEEEPASCPAPAGSPVADLLRAAARAREAGHPSAALSCAAGALALDPDDPVALLVAAEVHVTHLGGRDALEAGRALALRGASRAASGPRADPGRLPRLLLVAGMAENDLGRNGEALAHLDQALARDPRDLDAQYERAVALWELCRFPQARRAFERVLRRSPRDAWTLHHLGLLAERAGEERRAAQLLDLASRLAPGELPPPVAVSREAFEAELRRAVAELPAPERAALAGVPVEVEEIPDLADLAAVDPPLSPGILGIFRGPPLGEPCPGGEGPSCRSIALFRRNLLRFARTRTELDEQVRTTLLHELGHLHGESDEELRARGLE